VRTFPLLLSLALLSGCAIHPLTGRDQIVGLPAVQIAYSDVDFALSNSVQRMVAAVPCEPACTDRQSIERFAASVTRIGAQLSIAASELSPEEFSRIGKFQIEVDPSLGIGTASSAGGRIVLGSALAGLNKGRDLPAASGRDTLESGLGGLEPADVVIAFLIAREMAHVMARHAEENSGASIMVSALGLLVPGGNVLARIVVARLGSDALKSSWAAQQQSEAAGIALTLLERTGLSAISVSLALESGVDTRKVPDNDWGIGYARSARIVDGIAAEPLRYDGPVGREVIAKSDNKTRHVGSTDLTPEFRHDVSAKIPYTWIAKGAIPNI
jgi:hypothetical protein